MKRTLVLPVVLLLSVGLILACTITADTTLTCTITNAETTCSDTTNFPAVAAGSKLALKVVAANTPATSAWLSCSVCVGTN